MPSKTCDQLLCAAGTSFVVSIVVSIGVLFIPKSNPAESPSLKPYRVIKIGMDKEAVLSLVGMPYIEWSESAEQQSTSILHGYEIPPVIWKHSNYIIYDTGDAAVYVFFDNQNYVYDVWVGGS